MTQNKKVKSIKKLPPPPPATASWTDQAAYFEKYDSVDLEKAGYLQPLGSADKRLFAALKASARVQLKRSKREQLNLSLRAEELKRLQRAADRRHLQPSSLARAWLLERLDYEVPQVAER